MAGCCIVFYAKWLIHVLFAYIKGCLVWLTAMEVFDCLGLGDKFRGTNPGLDKLFTPGTMVLWKGLSHFQDVVFAATGFENAAYEEAARRVKKDLKDPPWWGVH